MGELHLLSLFAHHDKQHTAEQNTGGNQHLPIGQPLLQDESQHRDQPRKDDPEQRAFEHDAAAEPEVVALQKENDLKSLAIEGGKAEQDQSPPEMALGSLERVGAFEKGFAPPVVGPDPAAPVNLVEEPVHDHQQDDHRDQSGCSLEIQRPHVFAEGTDNSHGYEPGDNAAGKSQSSAEGNRAPVWPLRSSHACSNRSQHQNAFESFPENENADVEERDRRTGIGTHRIGCAVRGRALPNQHSSDKKPGHDDADAQNRLHLGFSLS